MRYNEKEILARGFSNSHELPEPHIWVLCTLASTVGPKHHDDTELGTRVSRRPPVLIMTPLNTSASTSSKM